MNGQLDFFAALDPEVLFPGRVCAWCVFCDYTSNGHNTYPEAECHCPSYSQASPSCNPEGTRCMATRYPEGSWMHKVQQDWIEEVVNRTGGLMRKSLSKRLKAQQWSINKVETRTAAKA